MKRFKYSVLGGSFDHLHRGHKAFLDEAFKLSEHVTIGLSTQKLVGVKKFPHAIEDYEARLIELEKYLKEKDYLSHAKIIPIDDIYGNTLKVEEIDALFITEDVLKNALKINEARVKNGLKPLELVNVPSVFAEDGLPISSTRIRSGEMDREGNLYINLFAEDLIMPESLREELGKPYGEILNGNVSLSAFTIAIGDVVVTDIIKQNKTPNISVYDLKTRRQTVSEEILNLLPDFDVRISNKAGTIESYAVEVLYKFIHESIDDLVSKTIEIEGEEDLIALPAILLAPLGSIVYYGLRDRGCIRVEVTEEKKNEVKEILLRFTAVK